MLKIIKPSDFDRRAVSGELFLRVDLNTISLSKQLCSDMNLEKGQFLGFTQDGDTIYIYQAKTEVKGFKLRGVADKGLQFSFAGFVHFLLKHYGLLDVLKGSLDFKGHRFPLERCELEGTVYYKLVPPKRLATQNPKLATQNSQLTTQNFSNDSQHSDGAPRP